MHSAWAERFRLRLAARAPADDRQRLWVIEADGVVAGYAATEPGADRFLSPPAGSGGLESLYLPPSAVGRRLGWFRYANHFITASCCAMPMSTPR